MKKVPQFLISLELWNNKLPNCQAILKLNAYFDPFKGDLIRVLVDDIKSSTHISFQVFHLLMPSF
jgi:hypothetical protein